MVGDYLGCKQMLLTTRILDFFRRQPPTDHEAGQVLGRRAAEAKRREALTIQERKDQMTRDLMALRAAGWPELGGSR